MRKFIALAVGPFVAVNAASVTPVEQVINLLQGLIGKGHEEKEAEASVFKSIEKTVHKQIIDANIAIEQNTDRISKFSAAYESASAKASQLETEIGVLNEELTSYKQQLGERKAKRKANKTDNLKTTQDLEESESALVRAIQVMQEKEGSIPASLVQEISETIPAARADLESLMQQAPAQASATAYEFQGGGILKLLQDLLKDFKNQLQESRTAEMNQENNFKVFETDVSYQIKGTQKSIADKTKQAGTQREKEGSNAKKRDQTKADLAAVQDTKKETETYFTVQQQSFTQNQDTRKRELEALGEAVKIVSNDVSGTADKHFPGDKKSQPEEAMMFLQIASNRIETNPMSTSNNNSARKSLLLKKASMLLQSRNMNDFHNKSSALSMVQAQMLTGGMFDKVINMINDLVARMEEEAAAELAHKQWCDKEMGTTKSDKTAAETEVDNTMASKEQTEADIGENKALIKSYSETIKELTKLISEETSEREKQKGLNAETVAESTSAQAAVVKAINIIEDFQATAPASLLQQKQQPEIATYGGMTDASDGIVSMLEVIQADFANLVSDTNSAEAAAASEYGALMKKSEHEKMIAETNNKKKKVETAELNNTLRKLSKRLGLAVKQQEAVTAYWSKLQPMCVVKHVSYEERVKQREEEIAALKDAYAVLNEESGGA